VAGVSTMVALVSALYAVLPPPANVSGSADRLAYALRLDLLAVLPLFLMIAAVGNARFASEAINPLVPTDNPKVVVNARVASNTLEQTAVFIVATGALSTLLAPERLGLLAASTAAFILARIAFWIGYRIHPLYRAAGMAATAYLNLGLLAGGLYLMLW
jgi:MAPEG family protein